MLIDDQTFTLLKQTIEKERWLELPASGNSMFPFIRQGNICRFVPLESHSLKKGDILLYCTQEGQLIVHRFVGFKHQEERRLLLLKGDSNLGLDQPIVEERILGRLATVKKKRLTITPDHFITAFWGKLILSSPILSGMLRKFLNSRFNLLY
jgi:signal peptidase